MGPMASSSAGKARVEEAQHSLARGFGRAVVERVDRLVGFFLARPPRHAHGSLARELSRLMDIPDQIETSPHQGAVCAEAHRFGIGRFAVAIVAGERQRVARPLGAIGHVGARTLDDLREDRFRHCLHLRSLDPAAYATKAHQITLRPPVKVQSAAAWRHFARNSRTLSMAGGLHGRPDKAAIRFARAASPGLNSILNPSQPLSNYAQLMVEHNSLYATLGLVASAARSDWGFTFTSRFRSGFMSRSGLSALRSGTLSKRRSHAMSPAAIAGLHLAGA